MSVVTTIGDFLNNGGDGTVSLDAIVTDYVNGVAEVTLSGADADSLNKVKLDDFNKTADEVEVTVDLSTFGGDFRFQFKDERPEDTLILQGANDVVVNSNGSRTITFTGSDGQEHTLTVDASDLQVEIAQEGGVEIGPGVGQDELEGGDGDDTITGGAGHDTIVAGSGDDVIVSGGDSGSLGGSGLRGKDFPLIKLGDHADIDTDESNGVSENASDLFGTYGDADQPLNAGIVFAYSNDLNDDDRLDDDDTGKAPETFTIQGEEIGLDSVQVYDASVTFADGTSGNFSAVVIQLQNGEVYLAPEPFENADSALLESGEIESISLNSLLVNDTNLYGMRLDMDYKVGDDDVVDAGAGDDTISAGIGDDSVLGGTGADSIEGGSGGDTLEGGSGDDIILGGSGDDQLKTGSGNDSLFGGEGADTLQNSSGDDFLSGGAGDDSIVANIGADTLDGGAGADTLIGGSGDDCLIGGSGADSIFAGSGDDVIVYGSGDDTVFGGAGDDIAFTGFSATGGPAGNIIDGGSGEDTISIAGSDLDGLDLEIRLDGSAHIEGSTISNFEVLQGGTGSETVLGSSGAETIFGGQGDEDVTAGGGADRVVGGSGDDNVIGGSGDDTLSGGEGSDTLFGGAGADSLTTGSGNDALFGGSGDDTLRNSSGDDSLVGGSGDDLIVASIGDDTLEGQSGSDTLIGGSGDDCLYGGTGQDQLFGSSGDDRIFGGDDQDTIVLEDDFGSDTIEGGEGGSDQDTLDFSSLTGPVTVTYTGDEAGTVTDGTDTLTFSEIERIVLTSGDDVVFGGADDSGFEIDAGAGDDTITGGTAADTIIAGDGDDSIAGGAGDDSIDFGAGADTVFGGAGADTIDGVNGAAGDAPNQVFGGSGDDLVFTGQGADAIFGGDGNDRLIGESGDDTIDGGAGDDSLTGGDGFDTFEISSGDDTISDFGAATGGDPNDGDASNNDVIDLSGYYDNISEARADLDDDGLLNQSNATDDKGRTVDYGDNTSMSGSTELKGASSSDLTQENTNLVCFADETLIAVPGGEAQAGNLKVGDLAVTLDKGPQPIRWVGKRSLSEAHLSEHKDKRPIRFAANCFAPGVPKRDLTVSPQHRIMLSGVLAERMFGEPSFLAPAKHLLNLPGATTIIPKGGVTYVHFLFESHEIVLSEGMPTESLYPGKMALQGVGKEACEEIYDLFPELAGDEAKIWKPARPFERGNKVRKLVERSVRNQKPLIDRLDTIGAS